MSVSMNFISGFPKVNNLSSVMVVADKFSKFAIFMASPDSCTTEIVVDLFHKNVVRHFGIPSDIVSDQDARFTGRFWTYLFNLLGSELKFSTTNEPQMDGQTEHINALLEESLRHFMSANQKNWLKLPDTAQFCYNLHQTSATGKCPFELALGFHPLTAQEISWQKEEP